MDRTHRQASSGRAASIPGFLRCLKDGSLSLLRELIEFRLRQRGGRGGQHRGRSLLRRDAGGDRQRLRQGRCSESDQAGQESDRERGLHRHLKKAFTFKQLLRLLSEGSQARSRRAGQERQPPGTGQARQQRGPGPVRQILDCHNRPPQPPKNWIGRTASAPRGSSVVAGPISHPSRQPGLPRDTSDRRCGRRRLKHRRRSGRG